MNLSNDSETWQHDCNIAKSIASANPFLCHPEATCKQRTRPSCRNLGTAIRNEASPSKKWQNEHPVLLLGPNTGENLQEKTSLPKKTIYETCWSWGMREKQILAIYIISQWLPSLLWVPIAIPRQLASINQLHRLHLSSTKPQPSPLNDNKMMMTQLWWQNPWSNNPPAPPQKKTYKIKHENTSHAKKLRLPTETGHTCTFNSFRPCWIFSANAFCQTQNGRQRRNNDQSQTKLVGEMLRPVSGKWGTPLDPNNPWKNEGFTPPSYGL